jgi:hypothetical protein
MEAALPDQENIARFMKLFTEVKIVAARVFPKHKDMFPGGLTTMYSIPLELQTFPMNIKADYLETHLEFLKGLDQQPDTTVQPNTERHVCPQVAPQPPSSAHVELPSAVPATLATESGSESISEVPLPPASLMKGGWGSHRTSSLEEGCMRTPKIEYWTFCYTMCRSEQKAIQMAHLNRAYQEANPRFQGHSRWLENKETLLFLFHAARVKIKLDQRLLVKTLKKFWEEKKVSLLKLLRAWFLSGAALSILEVDILHAALQHIRLEWKETDWWPNHGNDIDKICLTESVVTNDRLLEEWAACKQHSADYDYFRAEFEIFHKELETEKSMLRAARKKLKTSGNTSAFEALADAAAVAAGGLGAGVRAAGDDAGDGNLPQSVADSLRAPAAAGGLGAAGDDAGVGNLAQSDSSPAAVAAGGLGAGVRAAGDDVPESSPAAAVAAEFEFDQGGDELLATDWEMGQYILQDEGSRDSHGIAAILKIAPSGNNATLVADAESAAADSAHTACSTSAGAGNRRGPRGCGHVRSRSSSRGSDPGATRAQQQQEQQAASVSPQPCNAAAGEDSAATGKSRRRVRSTGSRRKAHAGGPRPGPDARRGSRSTAAQKGAAQQAGSVSPLPSTKGYVGYW